MIHKFLLNLALATIFVALSGSVTLFDFAVGFIIGLGIVSLLSNAAGDGGYVARLWGLVKFFAYFMTILVKANLEVAWEIITPGFGMEPRILRYNVAGLSDVEVTTLANAITLTPGTLSADLSEDGETLFIHAMYARDRDQALSAVDQLRHWLLREVFNHDC